MFDIGDLMDELHNRLGDGITYRQLDYWMRTGALGKNQPGSGNRRSFTAQEVEAVVAVATAYISVTEELREIRSGEMYTRCLALQEATP